MSVLPPIEYEDFVFDEATRRNGNDTPRWSGWVDGVEWGAGWMAAIIGMGQAIRQGRLCVICGDDLLDWERAGGWLACKDTCSGNP